MTVLVGIVCEDGIVIGSDSAATYGQQGGRIRTIEHPTAFKVEIIGDEIITATTGAVGLAQRVNHVLERAHAKKQFQQKYPEELGVAIHRLVVNEFKQTASPKQLNTPEGWGLGLLLGMPLAGQPVLIEFDPNEFHPEIKGHADPARGADRIPRFASMGSGQVLADPFLADTYDMLFSKAAPKVQRAKLAVVWTLKRVIDYNTGGIGGAPQLAVLQKDATGAWKAHHEDPQETLQHVDLLKEYISNFDPVKDAKSVDLDKELM